MRFTKGVPRPGAFIFLPIVLALGCSAPPPSTAGPPKFSSARQERMVFISVVGGKPVPSVDPVQLSRGQGHVAYWVYCGDGALNITLKDPKEDPFVGPFDNGGNHVRSAPVHGNAHYGKPFYKYTITLTLPGQQPISNDPDIEIDP